MGGRTIIGDALRQAFMQKHEYESLGEEEKAWSKLQGPLSISLLSLVSLSIFVSTLISFSIMFPGRRPLCKDLRMQPLSINFTTVDVRSGGGAFYLTDLETVDYYWMVVFLPSALLFLLSSLYLLAGITVAYTASTRHRCLMVVENNYCASKRGGVRCLSILNLVFAIIFGVLALFLGSTLLTLGSRCSIPLFWCYEITSWGLVILYGGTAFHLRRKASSDEPSRNLGLEMLEAEFTHGPDVERRVNEGFRSWMGSSYFSSDDDDDEEDDTRYLSRTSTNSSRQRV
ncbi:uncharacterized protein LOC143582835 [Bidens hawaiensis]|uniref:uncharacterized protein LOC143582835 n=1 Tax=Bidens hawaiensis TaxID=980011 RepID=UPI00404B212C